MANKQLKSLLINVLVIVILACVTVFITTSSAQQQQENSNAGRGHRAVVFGASGAVGSEVLRALLHRNNDDDGSEESLFWEEVVLIGRKFPPKVTNAIATAAGEGGATRVTQISLPDLADVDRNQDLLAMQAMQQKADACFLAAGVGYPHEHSLRDWHSIEVEMIGSMARLCNKVLRVQYIALLSSSENDEEPQDFSHEEFNESGAGPIGWLQMVKFYARMKGLEERAVTEASENIPFVRMFRPSTIVTEGIRYGWVDWTLFHLHKVLDPIMPTLYHSVPVRLLGMAMVQDALGILSSTGRHTGSTTAGAGDNAMEDDGASKVAYLHYSDYVSLAGEEFRKQINKNLSQEDMESKEL